MRKLDKGNTLLETCLPARASTGSADSATVPLWRSRQSWRLAQPITLDLMLPGQWYGEFELPGAFGPVSNATSVRPSFATQNSDALANPTSVILLTRRHAHGMPKRCWTPLRSWQRSDSPFATCLAVRTPKGKTMQTQQLTHSPQSSDPAGRATNSVFMKKEQRGTRTNRPRPINQPHSPKTYKHVEELSQGDGLYGHVVIALPTPACEVLAKLQGTQQASGCCEPWAI